MKRREFGKLAAAAMLASRWSYTTAQSTRSSPRPRFSVMLWALERQTSFDACLEQVAEAGYQGVELVGEFRSWSPSRRANIMARMRTLGMVFDAMSGVNAGFAVPAEIEAFRTQCIEQMRAAKELECSTIILLSGSKIDGLAAGKQRQASIDALKWAAEEAAKQQLRIVIEPIDLLENPTISMASVIDAFDIARSVNMPNLRVLYDFYHEQRSFGNLLEKLEKNIDLVGLVHIAGVPGRHEPDTGEVNFQAIYGKLAELRYEHWIAMEYYPTAEPVSSLRRSRMDALRAFAQTPSDGSRMIR
jgi:hydroxypyruvate isomerase